MTNQEIITAAGDLTAIYCMAAQSIILEKKEVQKNDCAGIETGDKRQKCLYACTEG